MRSDSKMSSDLSDSEAATPEELEAYRERIAALNARWLRMRETSAIRVYDFNRIIEEPDTRADFVTRRPRRLKKMIWRLCEEFIPNYRWRLGVDDTSIPNYRKIRNLQRSINLRILDSRLAEGLGLPVRQPCSFATAERMFYRSERNNMRAEEDVWYDAESEREEWYDAPSSDGG